MDARPACPSPPLLPGRGVPDLVHLARSRGMRALGGLLRATLLVLGLTGPARGTAPPAPTPLPPAAATPDAPTDADATIDAQARILRKAGAAVVGVRTVAARDARSVETLGRLRLGSGVVIDADGLVLTIGYLILEAEKVDLLTSTGRVLPARVVAYDLATGFGLLQSLVPLGLEPAQLGISGHLDPDQPHVVASGGQDGELSIVQVVSRRPFSGYWEYHIEDALFTVPPRTDHSGAALFNARGELMGIGSLVVMDATGEGRRMPGNMFVPVDLLKPVLAELRAHGSSRRSHRAWLGVNCVEQRGAVWVIRVTAGSPAEDAGLRPGDRILRIDGRDVNSLEGFYRDLWEQGAPERDIELEIERDGDRQVKKLHSIDRMKHLRSPRGI